jgi:STAS-like domain of unknown function (DUF4325)
VREGVAVSDVVQSRTVVRLSAVGAWHVSRSEARRLMRGLDQSQEIILDFRGVEEVGQGFVDEVFRVWPSQHPGHVVTPVGMGGPVEAMVRRGLPGRVTGARGSSSDQ